MTLEDAHSIHMSLNNFNGVFEGEAEGDGEGFSGCPGEL
jgi:hypothetical protein